ncbi:MAG: peptide deformylase [Patescibacteria group bacterium]|jgi:peptide deformylase
MVYDIVFEPEKMLHLPSAPVLPEEITSRNMQKFIKDMIETMYVKNGVGLAAVQVGKPIQLFTLIKTYNDLNEHEDLALFNPTWKKLSIHKQTDEEGCLSVPKMYGLKKRYSKILVSGLDKYGKKIEFIAEDFFARIIQHEVDHLNGHLYVEGATKLHQVE